MASSAEFKQSAVVAVVKQFGYIRNKDLAALLFDDDVRRAQRATQRAIADGLLVEKRVGGASRFTVAETANLLENVTGHRDASNGLLINAYLTGLAREYVTDRQVQINQKEYTLRGKIPDGLLLDAYTGESPNYRSCEYTWVEVENAERSGRDVAVLGNWIMTTFLSTRNWHVLPEYREGYLARVIVAISAPAADKIESRLLGYIQREYTSLAHAEYIHDVLPQRLQFLRV